MLKDYLLNWCQVMYEGSSATHCEDCNNREHCEHDCGKCLDQVHWYPQYDGRSDYNCSNLLLCYVRRYTKKYSGQIALALNDIDLSRYPEYDILSVGCGGTPDLMAFEELDDGKQINYDGYDRNPLWGDIHTQIVQYAARKRNMGVCLNQCDIFDVIADGTLPNQTYNVVVLQYLLSHLYNTEQKELTQALYDAIIDNVLPWRTPNSPFLIIITDIDTWKKGRASWFTLLDKLEDAGYHGRAFARSAYSDGDLGEERWSYHKSSPVFGNISYTFIKNSSESDGAQLVIELR